jgi:serine/threonine protein kinase
MTGKTILHYKILEKIGAGAMGVVYKARDLKLNRLVALKFLSPEVAEDSEALERFINEAQTASALDHANICTIHEINETEDGQMFLCMAYYDGETLKEKIKDGPMELEEAIDIARQIATGLQRAHQAGIIHRDIKPGNIIITQWGEVKILDFGIARLAGQDRMTKPGTTLGTVAYMSPEQVQRKATDHRTDIWSLGVVFYEMLSGQLPFSGDSEAAVIYSIVNAEPAALSEYRDDLPELVVKFIYKALAKQPDESYPGVEGMLADLQELKDENSDQSKALRVKSLHLKRFSKYLAVAMFVLVLGLAGLLWYFFGETGDISPTPLTITPFTRYIGHESHPSFSPDGNQVAFTWNGPQENNYDIYVKLIGTESILRLTTDPAADFLPAWSPDGRSIAFLRKLTDDKAGLYLMPAIGGPARKLAEMHDDPFDIIGKKNNLAWHPQGRWLVASDRNSPEEPVGLFLVSVDSGEKIRLTTSSPVDYVWGGDYGAAFSPDGKSLAFARYISYFVSDLYLLDLTADLRPSAEPKRMTFDEHRIRKAVFTPDGKEIIYLRGFFHLNRISLSVSAEPKRVLNGQAIMNFALSPKGGLLVYDQNTLEVNIWRIPLSDTLSAKHRPERLISSTTVDFNPQYSPDGQKIAFNSTRSGNHTHEVWVCDSDGSNPLQLTSFRALNFRWSPDSKSIVLGARLEGKADIYIINADGGTPRPLTTHPAEDIVPSWSSDGNWIYFASNRSGEFQVWKIKPDGSGAAQVTQNGGDQALDSPDGQYLYYLKDSQLPTSLWKVPAKGGEEKQIIDRFPGVNNFAVVEDGIIFIPYKGPGFEKEKFIRHFSFATGNIKTIATIEKQPWAGLAVSPDRRFILYCQIDREAIDLDLVKNFR